MTTDSKNRDLVSVMMPARNAEVHIAASIKSIQEQTHSRWELIFVDDGSEDNTLAIVNSFAATDMRIKVFSMPHGGRGRARNECLSHIRGEFVAICDSDDISLPTRFEVQLKFLKSNPDIGAVAGWWIPFSSESPNLSGPIRKGPTDPEVLARAFSRGKMRFHNACAMVRSHLYQTYGSYNVELRRAQDYEFYSRLTRSGVKLAALPLPLIYYRQEADIPTLAYFRENGMFMTYADALLRGSHQNFLTFANSSSGRIWWVYYTLKYSYFKLKLLSLLMLSR